MGMISRPKQSAHVSGEHLFVYGVRFFGSTLGLGCSNNLLIVSEEIQTRFWYSCADWVGPKGSRPVYSKATKTKQTLSADVIISIWHICTVTGLNCQELNIICKCSSASASQCDRVWLVRMTDGVWIQIRVGSAFTRMTMSVMLWSNSLLIRLQHASSVYNYLASCQF